MQEYTEQILRLRMIVLFFVIVVDAVAHDEPDDRGDYDTQDQRRDLVGRIAAVQEQRSSKGPDREAELEQAEDRLTSRPVDWRPGLGSCRTSS